MTLYSIILFVHVTAVLALFAAMTFEALSLFHLRRSSTLNEVRLWLDPVPNLPAIAMGSLLLAVGSGVYLIVRMSAFGAAWPKVTMAALLLIAPVAALSGIRLRAIRRTCAAAKAFHPDLERRLRDPILKASLAIRIAVILGIVLLMGAKPNMSESAWIVGASFLVGLLSSLLTSRRTAAWPAPR